MSTFLEHPLSYSHKKAIGLAKAPPIPRFRAPRAGETRLVLPSAIVREWLQEHPVPLDHEKPFVTWRRKVADRDRARVMAKALQEVEGRPLSIITRVVARELRDGAEALRRMQRAPGVLTRVAHYADELAREPGEVVRWISRGQIRHLPAGEVQKCMLCFEEDEVVWWGNWTCTRNAQRRIASAWVCRQCVETYADWPPAR